MIARTLDNKTSDRHLIGAQLTRRWAEGHKELPVGYKLADQDEEDSRSRLTRRFYEAP
jgi:hypothetical protein